MILKSQDLILPFQCLFLVNDKISMIILFLQYYFVIKIKSYRSQLQEINQFITSTRYKRLNHYYTREK